MLSVLLERYICTQLKQWFTLPDTKLSFNKGVLSLKNLSFSESALDRIQLPINFDFTLIESLHIEIPPKFEGSLKVHIKGVFISASSKLRTVGSLENRIILINGFVQKLKNKLREENKSLAQKLALSLISDKILKMLEVISLSIADSHLKQLAGHRNDPSQTRKK